MRFVQALDRLHRVTVVPFQQSGAAERAGLSIAQCESAAWAVTPGGERYRGAGAINATLAVALRTRLPLWVYELPGIRQLQDALYDWIAKNRGRFPGDSPYCQQYPDRCG